MIITLGDFGTNLSTAMTSKPSFLKAALTPAVPQKISSTTTWDETSKACCGVPSHSAVLGISVWCASLNACVLKHPPLKQTWRPFGQAPPTGAFVQLARLKSKHIGLFFASRPTHPAYPLGAAFDPDDFDFPPLCFPLPF